MYSTVCVSQNKLETDGTIFYSLYIYVFLCLCVVMQLQFKPSKKCSLVFAAHHWMDEIVQCQRMDIG